MTQLSLLEPSQAIASPTLIIAPVPFAFSLAPDRFCFRVEQGDRAYCYCPLQFTRIEALALLQELRKFDWRLNSDGAPDAIAALHEYVEQAMGGVA